MGGASLQIFQEMAEQESEVMAKIRDACKARNMLREALLDSKQKAEKMMAERKNLYEVRNREISGNFCISRILVFQELQRLEVQLDVCSAETWLATTEKNR